MTTKPNDQNQPRPRSATLTTPTTIDKPGGAIAPAPKAKRAHFHCLTALVTVFKTSTRHGRRRSFDHPMLQFKRRGMASGRSGSGEPSSRTTACGPSIPRFMWGWICWGNDNKILGETPRARQPAACPTSRSCPTRASSGSESGPST